MDKRGRGTMTKSKVEKARRYVRRIGCVALTLVLVTATMTTPVNAKAKSKKKSAAKTFTVYADAGHGCLYQTAATQGPMGFAAIGAAGEAAYTASFAKYYIAATNMTGTVKAKGISELSLNGIQGSNLTFGNSGRSALFAASGCDAMIQFHYDKMTPESNAGAHVIYSNNSANSIYLAYCIATAMKAAGCRMNDYYPMHISERHELSSYKVPLSKPLVMIELGMGVPGETDADYLRDPANIAMITNAINQGVANYRALLGL